MSWTENSQGVYTNDTDMILSEEGGQVILTFDDIEQDGLELFLELNDLFDNPFVKLAKLDNDGKLSPDVMPAITLGETFFANSDSEMLSLGASKGAICIRQDIAGGASYRLMGTNPAIMSHWVELRARFIYWNDVRNKPLEFNPSEHEHDDLYPRIGTNGKISASVLPMLNFFGTRYVSDSLGGMLSLPASIGSVCIRTDEKKMYICFGLPNLEGSWLYVPAPDAKIESIIMQGIDYIGHVEITPEAIGAALEEHTHDYPDALKELNNSILQFQFNPTNEEFNFYIDNDYIASLSKEGHKHNEYALSDHEHSEINDVYGNTIRFYRGVVNNIPTLFWSDPLNGGTWTPFA